MEAETVDYHIFCKLHHKTATFSPLAFPEQFKTVILILLMYPSSPAHAVLSHDNSSQLQLLYGGLHSGESDTWQNPSLAPPHAFKLLLPLAELVYDK